MPNHQYVIYRNEQGLLQGGWAPSTFDVTTMSDADKAKVITRKLDVPDVRMIDLNQLQIDLHEAMVCAGISKSSIAQSNIVNVASSVVVKHLAEL